MLTKETKLFCELFKIADTDKENNLKVLKQALKDNGFKLCGMGVELMIGEMIDLGMDEVQANYWKTLGITKLPYEPSKALD